MNIKIKNIRDKKNKMGYNNERKNKEEIQMENFKISKEKLIKIKDGVLFILLFWWIITPFLQTLYTTNTLIDRTGIYWIFMKIMGTVGIVTTIFTIYDKLKKTTNKKETVKQLLPIFLFVLFMIWTLFSSLQANRKNLAFNGNSYRKEGYYMYINYAGFFISAMLLENKKLRKILLSTFTFISVYLMIINRICMGVKYTNVFVNTRIFNSVFGQFNHYGYYLMMTLICSLGLYITEKNKKLKIAYLLAYIIIGYALIYNDTFGCYLAVLAVLVMYAIYALIKKINRKSIFVAIMIFAILSGVTIKDGKFLAYENMKQLGQDIKIIICKTMNIETEVVEGEEVVDIDEKFEETGTNRMQLWINGIKFALKKPIIGYGPDNLREEYLRAGIEQDRPHNLIIYLACVSGFPGMLLYVTAVGIIVIIGIKKLFQGDQNVKIYLMIVIAYLISSMFGNSMYYTSPYFFIFLGSLMHYNLKEKET